MFLTGPGVVGEVMGEDVDAAGLGGPRVHSANGVSQFVADDDRAAVALVRDLLSALPAARRRRAADRAAGRRAAGRPELGRADQRAQGLRRARRDRGDRGRRRDARGVRALGAQHGHGAGAHDGRPVGVIANQPWFLGGVIDATAAQKAARFVRTCNAFGLRRSCSSTPRLPARHQAGGARRDPPRRPSCCTRSPRRWCRRSRSCCARPTAAPTSA